MDPFLGGQNPDDEQQSGLQAPVTPGVTTREQVAQPTGASTSPTDSGTAAAASTAPGSSTPAASKGNAQAAGKAPGWTNLMSFLGAQSGDQQASVAQPTISTAEKNTAATTQAAGQATGGVLSDAAAGTDRGSVGGNSAPTGQPPSYDLSKVNLAGYQGPSASDATARFGAATAAGQQAARHAAAASTGQVAANAYDNAVATQTPTWGKILNAVGGEQQAAQNEGAQANAAGETVAQAQRTSDANVAGQKSALGDASKALATDAGTRQKTIQAYAPGLNSTDPGTIGTTLEALSKDPSSATALGLSSDQVADLLGALKYGTLPASKVHDMLSGYVTAAQNATGYSAASSDQTNKINGLLKNGAAAAAPGATGSGYIDTRTAAAPAPGQPSQPAPQVADEQALKTIVADKSNPYLWTQSTQAVHQLLGAGYTPEEIARLTGLTPDAVTSFGNSYQEPGSAPPKPQAEDPAGGFLDGLTGTVFSRI